MVDIFELIHQKCPDGVPVRPIEKVAKICKGQELSRDKLSETKTDEMPYPVMNMGAGPSGYWSEANREAGTITISGHGMTSGALNWFDEPFFASDGCYVFEPTDEIMPRYLYYALLARHRFLINSVKGELIRHLYPGDIARVQVPVPPLQIQREIVAILDKFDAYCNSITAGLAGELEMRRKQYRYWRDKIFQDLLDEGCGMKAIGELGKFDRGSGLDKSMLQDEGDIPVIHYGQIYTTYNLKTDKTVSFLAVGTPVSVSARHGDVVVCLTDTANLGFVGKAVAQICGVDVAISNDAGVLRLDRNEMNNVFLSYYMETGRFQAKKEMCKRGTTVMHLDIKSWQKIQVPVPDMVRQLEIVEVLDKFRELERELELRWKQYEYYRDMLLAFPEQKVL